MVSLLRASPALIIASAFAHAQDGRTADLILRHGAIDTMHAARTWVESLAVTNGRIIVAGPDARVTMLAGPSTKIVELGGRIVLPAFHDSHVHLMEGGVDMSLCNVKSVLTPREVLAEQVCSGASG